MSKIMPSHVDYLDLEINIEAIRKYEKCEQGTQSLEIEHFDVSTEAHPVNSLPPLRPPPLQLSTIEPLEVECTSIQSLSISDHTLKRKIKGMKNGTMKVTKEMCNKVTKVFKKRMEKSKIKKNSLQSPLLKRNTFAVDEEKNGEEITKVSTSKLSQSSPPNFYKSPTISHQASIRDTLKVFNCITINELASESSILSSYPIMSMIDEYMKGEPEEIEEDNMEEIIEHWIHNFVETCQRQIKNTILSTNQNLSYYIDLNSTTLVSKNPNFITIHTIPTWTQIRIIQDKGNQKYIALKKSHCLSWFVLPRECPKLNQRWVCYPIDSLNTFENEMGMVEENSLQWILLRMMMLKCFNKIYKNDVVPIKFDINNILLVSSSCGLIIVFKEGEADLNIKSFNILRSESLGEVPKHWALVKTDVREAVTKFFNRLSIISILISSIWPLDYLAYMFARLMMDTEN